MPASSGLPSHSNPSAFWAIPLGEAGSGSVMRGPLLLTSKLRAFAIYDQPPSSSTIDRQSPTGSSRRDHRLAWVRRRRAGDGPKEEIAKPVRLAVSALLALAPAARCSARATAPTAH